ncbi:peroxisomal membrane protein PEX13 [Condylostylus longicornis]|uniref:peroxisomal membrane protein PEX13 n=1 Tax=Condylostylus longicornis TaxID=2530218 RepID=UPI00244DD181|nr:peroxisomal membrane protein PEX13 [Condylostylus longicornis]
MDNPTNYRAPLLEPSFPSNIMRTPLGNVYPSSNTEPPSLPPPLNVSETMNFGSYSSGFGSYGNSYNGYGNNYGGYGVSPFGYSNFGSGMFGSGMYGGYGRGFGCVPNSCLNPYDPESRFIQLAEENSRPAFESIGSLVSAVANIAAMLDSTFYAITSSFHAILGVAANFGRLRGVFAQFWQTFAILRGLSWLYKKLLYWMKISNIDPSSQIFKEAFEAAKNETLENNIDAGNKGKKQSPWPVVIFLGFIFTAPYIVMKLLGNLTSSVLQETKDPRRWVKPIKSVALYDFQARNAAELTIKAGQTLYIAPKEIQLSQKLLNTGWAMATVDAVHSGLIPITYCKRMNDIVELSQTQNTSNITQSSNVIEPILTDKKLGLNTENLDKIPSDFMKIFNSEDLQEHNLEGLGKLKESSKDNEKS